MFKQLTRLAAVLLSMVFLCCSCGETPSQNDLPVSDQTAATDPTNEQSADNTAAVFADASWEEDDKNGKPDLSSAVNITLADSGTVVDGGGVTVTSSVVTVTKAGTYVVSGSLSDGQLRVETEDDGVVRLVLNGVAVHSNTTAPLFVRKSDKTILTLADGTVNTFTDSKDLVYEDAENEEPSAAVFSKSDLTINGSGKLVVTASFNDGIVSRDGLKMAGGDIAVTAADDAVMGRDYVLIGGGALTLDAEGDGIKSTNDAGDGVGFITIESGSFDISSGADGIQSETALTVTGGTFDITSGGGSQNGSANINNDFGWGMTGTDSQTSGKALKSGTLLTLSGGHITIDAADDAIHSNDTVTISGGDITAATADDGVHADVALTVAGGTLTVTKCYEGLEAATITIDDGDIRITASDDGINASSGSSETSGDRGMGGQNPFAADDSAFIINGGNLYVDAEGDGLDSNGAATMNGGNVWVVGPSNSGNGTFDYASAFSIRGGMLVAIGSMGMAQTPSSDTQNNVVWSGCSLSSGDVFKVTASGGSVIAEITSTRTAQWAYVTSPELQTGETYTVTAGADSEDIIIEDGGNAVGNSYGGMGGGMGGPGGGMMPPGGMGGGHRGGYW